MGSIQDLLQDRAPQPILAILPCDRSQLAGLLRALELKLHALHGNQAVHDDEVERRRLHCGRVDHALEFRAAVIGRA